MTLRPHKEIAHPLYIKDDSFFKTSLEVNIRMCVRAYFVLILKNKILYNQEYLQK